MNSKKTILIVAATVVLTTAIVLIAVVVCQSNPRLDRHSHHQYTGYIDERFVPILKGMEAKRKKYAGI